MAVPEFSHDMNLDGHTYAVARGNFGERQIAVTYAPKVKSERVDAIGNATLDPIEYTTFHRGAGASRNIGVPGMVAYGENIWTCDPGVLLPGPEVTSVTLTGAITGQPVRPDGIAEADGHLWVAAGQYVYRLQNGQALSPTPTQDLDLTSGHRALALRRFGSSMFLTQTGGTGALYERPDGGAWTAALLGGAAVAPTGALGRVWWTTGGVTSERLVAQFGPRGIRYTAAAPRNDVNWTPGLATPAIDMGGLGSIQRFVTTLNHLYIAGTAGLNDLDATGMAPNLTPQAELELSATSGAAAVAADGWLYYSSGYQLYRVLVTGQDYARVETITPLIRLPNETPVGGYGTAILKRGEWVIYAQYDPVNDTTWISWGREADTGGLVGRMPGEAAGVSAVRGPELGPFIWNVAPIVIHGWKVTALHTSGLASDGPRLWMFGHTSSGAVSARWAPLAYTTPYGDLKSGRARRFSQTGFAVLPSEDGGDDSIPKDIEELLSENENLGAGNSIRILARKETDLAFTQLADFNNGPRVISPTRAAFVSQRPTFRIEMTGTPASPPISRRLSVRWLPNPDVREVRRYLFKLGRFEMHGDGSWGFVGAEDQLERLVLLATTAARVSLIDEIGDRLLVRVLKIEGPTEYQAVETNDRALAAALTVSIFGGLAGPPFGYDQNVGWDSDHSWS